MELWVGGEAVDCVVDDSERTGQTARLTWTPTEAGTTRVVARAITGDGAVVERVILAMVANLRSPTPLSKLAG